MTKLVTRTVVQGSLSENTAIEASTDALTHAELDKNFYPVAIATNGTVEANKAIVVDANKDFTGTRNITTTGQVSGATVAGAMVDTTVTTSTTKVPHSSAVQTYVAANSDSTTLATVQATTSGDDIILVSTLPAGVDEIEIVFDSVSQSTTDEMILQIGTTGPVWTTSGYTSNCNFASDSMAASFTSSTAGFIITAADAAARVYSGIVRMRLINSVWVYESHLGAQGASDIAQPLGAGRVADPTDITHIRLSTTGAGTFDSGQVQVRYTA